MQLTHMGVLCQAIDPLKNKPYTCPVYAAPPCRHARNASYEGSEIRTPKNSLRWREHEHWNNTGSQAENERPFKVNHVRPKNMKGSICNGIIEVHPPSIFMSTVASQNGKLIEPGPRRQ